MSPSPPSLQPALLGWADRSLRNLPWRLTRDPWAILVAETMLQQTQVSRVIERWTQFLERFPDPASCAGATPADLLRELAGLGYNRRALMLHRAAIAIHQNHGGRVPVELDDLLALPGVGPYTARAIRAFAHEEPAAPVDTNIGRVLARLGGRRLTPGAAQRLADELAPHDQVWLWNQGIMELGALVCTKRAPSCAACPVVEVCQWQGSGPDPAEGSAAVGRPQARFVGSDRQLRGQVIELLRAGPAPTSAVDSAVAPTDPARRARVVEGLLADELIERTDEGLALVGDQLGPVSDASSASIA